MDLKKRFFFVSILLMLALIVKTRLTTGSIETLDIRYIEYLNGHEIISTNNGTVYFSAEFAGGTVFLLFSAQRAYFHRRIDENKWKDKTILT